MSVPVNLLLVNGCLFHQEVSLHFLLADWHASLLILLDNQFDKSLKLGALVISSLGCQHGIKLVDGFQVCFRLHKHSFELFGKTFWAIT